MSSTKKRVNLTVDNETYSELENLSNKRKKRISTISLDLIQQALELQEDIYFSKSADKRLSKKQRHIPHSKAWK